MKTDTPFSHCLIVRDSLSLNIDLEDINLYTTSDFRGRGNFVDNHSGLLLMGV